MAMRKHSELPPIHLGEVLRDFLGDGHNCSAVISGECLGCAAQLSGTAYT